MIDETPVILHLIDSFGIGGAQRRYFNDLAHFGPSFEHWPCAVFDDGAAPQVSPLPPHSTTLGIRTLYELPIALARLIRMVRRNPRIRLIHTQLFASDTVGRIASRACGRRVVSTVQSAVYEPDSGLYSRWRHNTDRATWRLCVHMIAVSALVRASVHRRLGVPLEKITVIRNSVDTRALRPSSARRSATRAALGLAPEVFAWLTVGRLHAAKGLAYLVDAFARISAVHPETALLVAGAGPSLGDLQRQSAAAGVADRVHFLGVRPDVLALLDAADAFVFPSLSEGLPVSVLEAMAMEKACVLSRIGPHEEIVEHGVSGLLATPRDVDELVAAMLEVQRNAAYRERLGACARMTVVNGFDSLLGARRLEQLYMDVL